MADTIRGDFGDRPCSDCGERGGVYLRHWGPLVPPGADGFFDAPCFFIRRYDVYEAGRAPKPLGQQWPVALRDAALRAMEQDTPIELAIREATAGASVA